VNEIVGSIGGKKAPGFDAAARRRSAFEFRSGNRTHSNPNHVFNLIVRGEERFLVFLQIAPDSSWAGLSVL